MKSSAEKFHILRSLIRCRQGQIFDKTGFSISLDAVDYCISFSSCRTVTKAAMLTCFRMPGLCRSRIDNYMS
jgi:hypothetical protein